MHTPRFNRLVRALNGLLETCARSSEEAKAVEALLAAISRNSSRHPSNDWLLKLENADKYFYPKQRSRDAIRSNIQFILKRYEQARNFEIFGGRPSDAGNKFLQVADTLAQAAYAANSLSKVERRLLALADANLPREMFAGMMRLTLAVPDAAVLGSKSFDDIHERMPFDLSEDILKLERILRLKGELLKQADVGGRNQFATRAIMPPPVHQLINDSIRLLEFCGVQPTGTEMKSDPSESNTGLLQYIVNYLLNAASKSDTEVPIPVQRIKYCVRTKKAFVASITSLREHAAAYGYANDELQRLLNMALNFLPEFPDRKEFHDLSSLVVEVRKKRNAWLKTCYVPPQLVRYKKSSRIPGANQPQFHGGSPRDIPDVLD